MTFWLCGPEQVAAGCGGGGTQVGDPVATEDQDGGTTATSSEANPTEPGIYCFRADYQPGPNEPFAAVSHTNDTSECFTVTGRPKIGIEIIKGGPKLAHVGDTITYTFDVRVTTSRPLQRHDRHRPALRRGTEARLGRRRRRDPAARRGLVVHVHPPRHEERPRSPAEHGDGNGEERLCGCTATDTDEHTVDLIHPKIDIVKTVDPKNGHPGDEVTYSYTVTNTGDTTLYHVVVNDDVLGHIGTIKELAPGESVVLTKKYTLPSGVVSVKNVATVSGSDTLGLTVDSDANAVVTIVAAASASASTSPGTAFTGSNAAPLGALAGGLGLLGLFGLAVGRKRSREA